ncbi:MAG: hypothetical protein HQL90_06890 [Magnetococcales bacterium]|nr:hypothetical protein [Magnetococcales bacterium]
MSENTWPLLRKQVIIFCIVWVQTAGFVGAALYYRDEMAQQVAQMRQQLQSLENKKRLQQEENQRQKQYHTRVRFYQDAGLFEPEEPRLRWVEQIMMVEKALKLPVPIRFKLEVHKPFIPTLPAVRPLEGLFSSRMELILGLLHEGDLLDFFQRLAKSNYALYDIKTCTLERRDTPVGGHHKPEVDHHLTATCQLEWYWYGPTSRAGKGGM